MKRHRRTSWTTELHTYNTQATKEESIIDFLHKVEVAKAFLKQVNDTVHIEIIISLRWSNSTAIFIYQPHNDSVTISITVDRCNTVFHTFIFCGCK